MRHSPKQKDRPEGGLSKVVGCVGLRNVKCWPSLALMCKKAEPEETEDHHCPSREFGNGSSGSECRSDTLRHVKRPRIMDGCGAARESAPGASAKAGRCVNKRQHQIGDAVGYLDLVRKSVGSVLWHTAISREKITYSG